MATINGTAGNDSLTGTASSDSISGLGGNDTLNGLGAIDTLNGGAGNDTYIVTAGDVLQDSGGIDTVRSDITWTLGAGFENITLTGTSAINATGNELDNFAIGNSGANTFNMRAGNDTVQAGAGDDRINISSFGAPSYGDDVVDGGAGFDALIFQSPTEQFRVVVDLAAGTAHGGGQAGAGSVRFTSIERVIGTGFNDALFGSAASERFEGRGGDDILSGMAGNDTLSGEAGQDRFEFAAAPGPGNIDLITDFVSGSDTLLFHNIVFKAIGVDGDFSAGDARFASGPGFTAGRDASDRIVYNTTTGQLFYDADGSGTSGPVLVATLQGAPVLVATDIFVVRPFEGIQGTDGADSLAGTDSDDTIEGFGGNDLIEAFGGHDAIEPGDGNDTVHAGAGFDSITLDASTGTYGNDQLDGGDGDDRVQIFVAQSAVNVNLAAGTFSGGGAGGTGSATLRSIEDITTGSFHDRIDASGTAVTHVLHGGPGNDTLIGGAAGDHIRGDSGNDFMVGGAGDDIFDNLFVEDPFHGDDTMEGGPGNDQFVVDGSGDVVTDTGGGIDTVLSISDYALAPGSGVENLFFFNHNHDDNSTGASFFRGNELDNVLSGAATLDGGAGNDRLVGGSTFLFTVAPGTANADVITRFSFQSGHDAILLDNAAHSNLGAIGGFAPDDPRFAAGSGFTSGQDATDRVIYNTSTGQLFYDADGNGAAASQLIVTLEDMPTLAATDIGVIGSAPSTGGQRITGTAGNDSLSGTDGNDTLDGLGGVDTMNGLLGNDTYVVTAGDVLQDSDGVDTVMSGITWTLGAGFENITLTGTSAISATGNELNNLAIGNSAANTFNLRAGNDTVQAGAGDDRINLSGFGSPSYGDDVVDGGAGFDALIFQSATEQSAVIVDFAAGTAFGGGQFGRGTVGFTSIERVIGTNGFNDRLSGSGVSERFEGRGGNDTLSGLGGNDTLAGELGNDTFVFASTPGSGNVDLVTDFASATDKVAFENAMFTAVGGAGNFAAGDARFAAGAGFTSGRDASDRIIYNTTTGALYYDADGSSGGAAVQIATLQGAPVVAATDITVI